MFWRPASDERDLLLRQPNLISDLDQAGADTRASQLFAELTPQTEIGEDASC
jgi:hypothetical protein